MASVVIARIRKTTNSPRRGGGHGRTCEVCIFIGVTCTSHVIECASCKSRDNTVRRWNKNPTAEKHRRKNCTGHDAFGVERVHTARPAARDLAISGGRKSCQWQRRVVPVMGRAGGAGCAGGVPSTGRCTGIAEWLRERYVWGTGAIQTCSEGR